MTTGEVKQVLDYLADVRPVAVTDAVDAANRANVRVSRQEGCRAGLIAGRATLELQLIAKGGLAVLGR